MKITLKITKTRLLIMNNLLCGISPENTCRYATVSPLYFLHMNCIVVMKSNGTMKSEELEILNSSTQTLVKIMGEKSSRKYAVKKLIVENEIHFPAECPTYKEETQWSCITISKVSLAWITSVFY